MQQLKVYAEIQTVEIEYQSEKAKKLFALLVSLVLQS